MRLLPFTYKGKSSSRGNASDPGMKNQLAKKLGRAQPVSLIQPLGAGKYIYVITGTSGAVIHWDVGG